MSEAEVRIIARIESDFPTKFAIPRQSGLVDELRARVVFEPEFRNPDALRGLEGFSHIWLIWQFSKSVGKEWSPTVRPPRLGGNERMGVFATRSPFRPNPIGLSCVRLERVDLHTPKGPVLVVAGADLMDGTPIYDIKPYLAFSDSHPEAKSGFAEATQDYHLEVHISNYLLQEILHEGCPWDAIKEILSQDPRPAYQNAPERVYHLDYEAWAVDFTVDSATVCVKNIVHK